MRELKFRAWHEPLGEMYADGWYTYCRSENSFNTINDHFKFLEKTGLILMQYTGLRDKGGTEIYEGDIVAMDDMPPAVVVYDSEALTYCFSPFGKIVRGKDAYRISNRRGGRPIEQGRHLGIKIIGNIHENPELLQEVI